MALAFQILNARKNDDRFDDFAALDPTGIQLNHTESRIRVSLPAPTAVGTAVVRHH